MKFIYILENKADCKKPNTMDTATDCVTGKCLYMSMSSH